MGILYRLDAKQKMFNTMIVMVQKLSDEWHCTPLIVRFHVRWEHVSCTAILLHHVDAATPQRYKAHQSTRWTQLLTCNCLDSLDSLLRKFTPHNLSACQQVQVLLQLTSFPTTPVTKGTFLTCELRVAYKCNTFSGFRRKKRLKSGSVGWFMIVSSIALWPIRWSHPRLSDWNTYESCAVQELEAGPTGVLKVSFQRFLCLYSLWIL